MKTHGTVLSTILAFAVALAPASSALAASSPTPAPAPTSFEVSPASLMTQITTSSLPVLEELNDLVQAKTTVDIARANLLPSFNLGTIIGAATGGSFALSSVSMLLPFLLPSNWENLKQSQNLLQSEMISYNLVELNQVASGYSLYETVIGDNAVAGVLQQEYNELISIRDYLTNAQQFSPVPQSDIDKADAQAQAVLGQLSQMDQQIANDNAAIRQAFALPETTVITLDTDHVPVSAVEGTNVNTVIAQVQQIAPENTQIAYMIAAATDAKWSKVFSFLGGASLSLGSGGGGAGSFSGVNFGTSINLGFATVPTVALANENVDNLQEQATALKLSEQEIVEATMNSVTQAKNELAAANTSFTEYTQVFQDEYRSYKLGLTPILNVLQDETSVASAAVTVAQAQINLDNLRITLHRELITDQFASVPKCTSPKPAAVQLDDQWLGKLFDPSKYVLTIDDVCGTGTPPPHS